MQKSKLPQFKKLIAEMCENDLCEKLLSPTIVNCSNQQ